MSSSTCHRLDIKHIKTVTYWPQANLSERVNRTLVQMIACFVEENPDIWDRFLHEFSFALRTAVNETTRKTPAELFLGQKIITPFRKLEHVESALPLVVFTSLRKCREVKRSALGVCPRHERESENNMAKSRCNK
ncbi:retrovirus-related Pol polyprotein from transposon 297 [Trichonephila clavipes]|nr:retrovirus-related Pol polyprotein from transposon 297 [Trichonephila clavipes]